MSNFSKNNGGPKINHNGSSTKSLNQLKYHTKSLMVVLLSLFFVISLMTFISFYNEQHGLSMCKSKDCIRASSNLLQSMDMQVDPCDDFYQFTCGNWEEDHPRPDSVSSYDWFSEKQLKVLRFIRQHLKANGTKNDPRIINQTRVMFHACMDTDRMDALGMQPVLDYLKLFHLPSIPSAIKNNKTNNTFDWIQTIAEIKRTTSIDIIFGFDIFPDPTNRQNKRIVIGTPEMNSVLPFKTEYGKHLKRLIYDKIKDKANVEYDLTEDEDTVGVYTSYMTEVITTLILYSDPEANLEVILPAIKESTNKIVKTTKFFIGMAEEAENITSDSNYIMDDLMNLNIIDFQTSSEQSIAPKTFPIWQKYLKTIFTDAFPMFDDSEHSILTSRSDMYYIQQSLLYISKTPIEDLELYIWWVIVEEMVLQTTSDIRKMHNDYAKTITQLEEKTSLSLYCTSTVNQLMGMAVSYTMAQPNFYANVQPRVIEMINNIRSAFGQLVADISWMDISTKFLTLEKSNAMKSFVGYPEWILENGRLDEYYTKLNFSRKTHLKNLINVLQWQMLDKLTSLNFSRDTDWATTPTNVNAFHTFQANAITVPMAILQYPFFNLGLEAMNYGAIGSILGHEFTHGFDDNGRQFDKNGNIRQWWSNSTIAEYISRTECFITQYNNYYIPEIDEHINGKLTLGENIADNGGLREAFYAYKFHVKKHGKERSLPGLEQFTHEQLLFMSFGNLWCETQTPVAKKWSLEDTHCPGNIRLRGVLENSNEFKQAFKCAPKISEKQCRIW